MATQWKHIGFHGLAVGTFSCGEDAVTWKSAATGTDETSTARKLSKDQMESAASWTAFGKTGSLRLAGRDPKQQEWRLDGFPLADFDMLKSTLKSNYDVNLKVLSMSSAGTQYGLSKVTGKLLKLQHCELADVFEEGQEFEVRTGEEIWSVDLTQVSQCVLPGTNRNELELQFPESDTIEAGTDQLVAIRMYIPPDPEADPADKEADTAAEVLQQSILNKAQIRKTTGADVMVTFPACAFLTPRGRYDLELFDSFLRMRGPKYDYKIRYDDIARYFLLPKPDEVHMAFVICLDKPIRQGQQRYQYLVMQAVKEQDEVQVHLDEETMKSEYNGDLQPVMRGAYTNLLGKIFKVVTRKKVLIPGKFSNAGQQACLNCSVRANEGLLYPLERQFVFIHKPPIIVKFKEISSVEFQRYAGGSTRGFDLCVRLSENNKEYVFSGIDRSDYTSLYNFLDSKGIRIQNLQTEEVVDVKATYKEEEIFGTGADDMPEDEESEDESYGGADAERDEAKASADVGEGSSDDSDNDIDDDELGSEIDDNLDSDLEEARAEKKPVATKKSKPVDSPASSPAKKRKKKDKNAPKRAMSGYMFFMNSNRDRIKEENPDAEFKDIAKIAGAEWKKMTADDKIKYETMAKEDKERYAKEMANYVPEVDEDDGDTAAPKKKKAKKDPNAPKRGMSAYLYFANDMRPKVKATSPDLSFSELNKMIGEKYKQLTADEREKFEKMARKDKERYTKEMDAYKNKKQADDDGVHEDDDDDSA